jgi:hypothetical protein
MGDFLYGKVLGYVIVGVPILVFKIMRFALRIVWWLGFWVILSVGAGLMSITRTGKSEPDQAAGFGQFSDDRKLWRDEASGQLFRCSETDREHCEIQANLAGQYWRRTALSRLGRAGAIWRYRFDAVTDDTADLAATHEFAQEARVNLSLDTVDPAHASTDEYNQARNRDWALEALTRMDWLLTSRGWQQAGRPANPSNQHWYASRYERPVIFWTEPVGGEAPSPEAGGPSAAAQATADGPG